MIIEKRCVEACRGCGSGTNPQLSGTLALLPIPKRDLGFHGRGDADRVVNPARVVVGESKAVRRPEFSRFLLKALVNRVTRGVRMVARGRKQALAVSVSTHISGSNGLASQSGAYAN
jgi:hypothetical protein